MSDVLLHVADMHVSYRRVEAVHGVSLDVAKASIVTVIGANGAGKTTLLNAIMGVMKGRGNIEFDGKPVADLSLEARVANGLCLVPERRELFSSMPVEDKLLLGGLCPSRGGRAQTPQETYAPFSRLQERGGRPSRPPFPGRRAKVPRGTLPPFSGVGGGGGGVWRARFRGGGGSWGGGPARCGRAPACSCWTSRALASRRALSATCSTSLPP